MADADLHKQMLEIERLVDEIHAIADPEVRTRAVDLVKLLLDVHGAGLRRIVEMAAGSGPAGKDLVAALSADPLVSSLLLLYGLHPRDLETRVLEALDKARPALQSHGGDVELVSCDAGVVRLRLTGSCHGCPSSTLTLRQTVEEALCAFAPDMTELHVDGAVPSVPTPSSFVPLAQLV